MHDQRLAPVLPCSQVDLHCACTACSSLRLNTHVSYQEPIVLTSATEGRHTATGCHLSTAMRDFQSEADCFPQQQRPAQGGHDIDSHTFILGRLRCRRFANVATLLSRTVYIRRALPSHSGVSRRKSLPTHTSTPNPASPKRTSWNQRREPHLMRCRWAWQSLNWQHLE